MFNFNTRIRNMWIGFISYSFGSHYAWLCKDWDEMLIYCEDIEFELKVKEEPEDSYFQFDKDEHHWVSLNKSKSYSENQVKEWIKETNKRKELMSCPFVLSYMRNVILQTHEIKQIKNSFDYKGEELTCSDVLAGDFTIKESFTEDIVNHHQEFGEDFLYLILRKTFQLGYEQAIRKYNIE